MSERVPQDQELKKKCVNDHIKVLKYLMNTNVLKNSATGKLESPQKLVIFYAGYIAMRRIWELKTAGGKKKSGDFEIDENRNNNSIIYRIDKEVAHPLGNRTDTLFRIKTFKYWAKKFLKVCKNDQCPRG